MRTATIIILLELYSHALLAQCSDAGVCVIGSKHALAGHQISARYVFGKSGKADDLTIHSVQVEGSLQLLVNSKLAVLLPGSRTSGPLGTTSGIGDLTMLWNQTVWENAGDQISFQIGAKLATGLSNSEKLPQAYQPGLGTNDLLMGISCEADPWAIALGYQLSRGRSNNAVTRLQRGDDLLARVGYKTRFAELIIGLEILAIKRLEKSSVLDPAVVSGEAFTTVAGSDQFQTNIVASLWLPLNGNYGLRSFIAVPVRGRSVNVDGLTRSITLSLGAQYAF